MYLYMYINVTQFITADLMLPMCFFIVYLCGITNALFGVQSYIHIKMSPFPWQRKTIILMTVILSYASMFLTL